MNRINAALTGAVLVAAWSAVPMSASAQQAPPQPAPSTARPTTMPSEPPRGQVMAGTRRSGGTLQGFSVVLVVGDLQGAGAPDDVPLAARKALADMREFLPYKSYRLLDAGWLMCCGEQLRPAASERRTPAETPRATALSTLALRGPDEQEYELRLSASRSENARVFVQFALIGSGAPASAAMNATSTRMLQRRIADLEDKTEVLRKQTADARSRVEVGTSAGTEIPKMELEMRTAQREVAELRERLGTTAAAGSGGARGSSERYTRSAVIDTSFTMDVGETVVVGASRPRGATKALIALVTAVPRGGSGVTRD